EPWYFLHRCDSQRSLAGPTDPRASARTRGQSYLPHLPRRTVRSVVLARLESPAWTRHFVQRPCLRTPFRHSRREAMPAQRTIVCVRSLFFARPSTGSRRGRRGSLAFLRGGWIDIASGTQGLASRASATVPRNARGDDRHHTITPQLVHNKVRTLGFIECNGGLKVNNSLLGVVRA